MMTSRRRHSRQRTARSALMVACCLVIFAGFLWLQTGRVQAQDDLSVRANYNPQPPLTPDTPIELHLNRSLKTDEGHIAVIIDRSDVTSLFITNGTRLGYSPSLVPFRLGESQVIVYRVSADGVWNEI